MTPEPPEWQGRGVVDRSGWPNSTYHEIRSHRKDHPAWEVEQEPSFDPEYDHDMPTEPNVMSEPVAPPPSARGQASAAQRPIVRPQLILEREEDPLWRACLWLWVFRDVLAIVALVGLLICIGVVLRQGGVPLWVPRS
jgi:hypothetical protein